MTPPRIAPTNDSDEDPRPARLGALELALRVHHFEPALTEDLLAVSTPARPGYVLEVRCDHRASAGGELWFTGPDGLPLAPAHDITGALVAIKGLTAARM